MKYLRKQILDRKNVTGNTSLYIDIGGELVVNRPYSMLVPKGTTAQRSPDTTAPVYTEGMIRFNTTTGEFEGYQGSQWRSFRYKESTAITQETVGIGDGSTVYFGPLDTDPLSYDAESGIAWDANYAARSIIVLVENVFQIPIDNYTLVQNPPGIDTTNPGNPWAAGTYLLFGTAVPANKPVYVLYGFDK